jgi:molecular chaperone HtpG
VSSGAHNFQVDLHGVVDLLSHHLYSSPRVYLRELLQNAVDALTARRLEEPDCPGTVAVSVDTNGLTVSDTGIGLTRDQVADLLATIGRSSKRDEIGFARQEFLGQFGIGLLSAFMVADEVRVTTRPTSGSTTRWVGTADGRYTVADAPEREVVGTTVTLVPRPGTEVWFQPDTVRDLARTFGSLLPFEVTVNGVAVTEDAPPWSPDLGAGERRARLVAYAQDELGFTPFDVIDLAVPAAGLSGVAFVLPFPANPTERATHRVYLKRMLLAEHADGLLPDWAFFVRCLVDTGELRPTASREALYDDHHLEETREALGDQVKGWLVRLGTTSPQRLAKFLDTHHLGVKALALYDDEMLALVERWLPIETNQGRMTLAEYRERHGVVRYVASVEEFRQLAAVAAAQGVALVNAGYTYEADIIERLPDLDSDIAVARFDPSELATAFDLLDPATELAMRPFVALARETLDQVGCDVALRAFDPPSLSAMYLVDRSAAFATDLRSTRERADGLWAEVLDVLETHDSARPQLVINYRSPLVRRLAHLEDHTVVRLAIEGLYGHALMLGYHPIRPADSALVNRSFLGLLEQAVPTTEEDGG